MSRKGLDKHGVDTLGEQQRGGAGRLDGLLLDLHGAMVCEGSDYVELEAVRLCREVVGEIPVAEVEARKEEFSVRRDGPAVAVRRALGADRSPVVLADVADNIGAGSPGDGTAILEELLAQGAQGAVVLMVEPTLSRSAARLGPGTRIEADAGAKTDSLHGSPVRVRGRVRAVTDGRYHSGGSWMTGREFCMGTTAVVEVEGVTLVAMERTTPPFHREQLTSVGIEPEAASIIAHKGAVAWRAAFGDVAAEAIEVDTPGVCPVEPTILERKTEPMGA